ncbi:chemotaxis protein CheW [Aporhodopirellula aestuarii]|uniref:Chemotaxis protein CheW n=1 Tax=Aporhodopirellula aestuarii TaxID=2950107 RepID=A0ABT0U9N5_9BACT|nr:chemotaxis protein CheW [Aporhodopirellula aestuarii]MCM2373610.1 chemotaxis protein CheW [Aporhodopirellula aestuarii]
MPSQLLVFHIDDVRFGFSSIHVREVLLAATISSAAGLPPSALGALNLRGEVVIVLDARRLLRFPDKPISHSDHLIVVSKNDQLLAIRVDRAVELLEMEVIDSPADHIPSTSHLGHQFAKLDDELVQVIDFEELLAGIDCDLAKNTRLPDEIEASR